MGVKLGKDSKESGLPWDREAVIIFLGNNYTPGR